LDEQWGDYQKSYQRSISLHKYRSVALKLTIRNVYISNAYMIYART